MVDFRNPNAFDIVMDLPAPDGLVRLRPGEAAAVSDASVGLVRARGYLVIEVAVLPASAPVAPSEPRAAPTPPAEPSLAPRGPQRRWGSGDKE